MSYGRVILPITWCNFTLVVLEDFEEDDEADSSRVVGPYDRTAASNDNRGLPKFIKLDTMQRSRLVVKPPGATVTFKCRANGMQLFANHQSCIELTKIQILPCRKAEAITHIMAKRWCQCQDY